MENYKNPTDLPVANTSLNGSYKLDNATLYSETKSSKFHSSATLWVDMKLDAETVSSFEYFIPIFIGENARFTNSKKKHTTENTIILYCN